MNDSLKESLSALMDGEASEFELRRVLESDDPELRRKWSDSHQFQQLLKGDEQPYSGWDISARVAAEIADDVASPSAAGWRQAFTGIAVAASVAFVVVLGALGSNKLTTPGAMVADNSAVSGRVYPTQVRGATGGVTVSATAQSPVLTESSISQSEAQRRFEYYLRNHTDRAALNNNQGVISYARTVSPESK